MVAKTLDRKLHKSWRHGGGEDPAIEGPTIEMDAEDIEECRQAAAMVYAAIRAHHGIGVANKVFSQQLLRRQQIKDLKNYHLLNIALQRLSGSSQSVDQIAAELAEENKSMPEDLRHGPRGTINPTTMARHIRRLIDDCVESE